MTRSIDFLSSYEDLNAREMDVDGVLSAGRIVRQHSESIEAVKSSLFNCSHFDYQWFPEDCKTLLIVFLIEKTGFQIIVVL